MLTATLRRALVLGVINASTAAAQSAADGVSSPNLLSTVLSRSSLSIAAIQGRPQDAMSRNMGRGYGVDGAYLLRLDDAGVWGLRASIAGLSYDRETRQRALSETVGGRVQVDVSTSNYIVPVSVGPQVSWPRGPVRPYLHAGVGGQFFYSESRAQGLHDGSVLASTVNHSASTAAWTVGGGISAPMNAGRTRVEFDAGAQYVGGGTSRYLTKGSIADLPSAQITVTPRESTTHLLVVRIGARVRL